MRETKPPFSSFATQAAAKMVQATEEYRQENDPLNDFLADCCVLQPEAWATVKDVWDACQRWATDYVEKYTVGRRKFGAQLKARGCENTNERKDGKIMRLWRGVGLLVQE